MNIKLASWLLLVFVGLFFCGKSHSQCVESAQTVSAFENAQIVTNLGVVGDGVTNNFLRLKKILAVSGKYYFPAGTYIIENSNPDHLAPIEIFDNTELNFASGAKIAHQTSMQPLFVLNQQDNVTIDGLVLEFRGKYNHLPNGQLGLHGRSWAEFRNSLAATYGFEKKGLGAFFPASDILIIGGKNHNFKNIHLTSESPEYFQHTGFGVVSTNETVVPEGFVFENIKIDMRTMGFLFNEASQHMRFDSICSDSFVESHTSPGHLFYFSGRKHSEQQLHNKVEIHNVIDLGVQQYHRQKPLQKQNRRTTSFKLRGGREIRISGYKTKRASGIFHIPGCRDCLFSGAYEPDLSLVTERVILLTSPEGYSSENVALDVHMGNMVLAERELIRVNTDGGGIRLTAQIQCVNKGEYGVTEILNWRAKQGSFEISVVDSDVKEGEALVSLRGRGEVSGLLSINDRTLHFSQTD